MASFDCGIRRIWLYNHETDQIRRVRTEGVDTLGDTKGYARKASDWICHEMWSDDGNIIIYHGGYANGPALVGRYDLSRDSYWEIALPDEYKAYGHFTMDHQQVLCCDGYFKFADDVKIVRENSTDNGDWLGQDAHPHPVYNHAGTRIYFNSRSEQDVKVYCIPAIPDFR